MKKRGLNWLIITTFILSFNLISAATGLGDFLDAIGTETIVLISGFIISFALTHYSLNKALEWDSKISAAIAVAIAFLVTQGINKFNLGFQTQRILIDVGITSDLGNILIGLITLLAIVLFIIYLIKKGIEKSKIHHKKSHPFKILIFFIGSSLIALGIFADIYNSIVITVVGSILILLALFSKGGDDDDDDDDYEKENIRMMDTLNLILLLTGIGLIILGVYGAGGIYTLGIGFIAIILLIWRNWKKWKIKRKMKKIHQKGRDFENWKEEKHERRREQKRKEAEYKHQQRLKNLREDAQKDLNTVSQHIRKNRNPKDIYEKTRKAYIAKGRSKRTTQDEMEIIEKTINKLDEMYADWVNSQRKGQKQLESREMKSKRKRKKRQKKLESGKKRKKRQKRLDNLRKRYKELSKETEQIYKKVGGHIPSKKKQKKAYKRYMDIRNKMKKIEKMLKKFG